MAAKDNVALILAKMDKDEEEKGKSTSSEEENSEGDVGLETAIEEFFSCGKAMDWSGAAKAWKDLKSIDCNAEEETEDDEYGDED